MLGGERSGDAPIPRRSLRSNLRSHHLTRVGKGRHADALAKSGIAPLHGGDATRIDGTIEQGLPDRFGEGCVALVRRDLEHVLVLNLDTLPV